MTREKPGLENRDESSGIDATRFSELFPGGKVEEIDVAEVPELVMALFERKSKQFVDPDKYRPGNFEHYFVIEHEDGKKTYLAQQTKTYSTNQDTERLTFFVDIKEDTFLGYSEIRYNISQDTEYFKGKPFIGFTETEEGFRREGLGTRRIKAMNAYSQALYGLPLYSDTLNSEKSIWESLVKQGLARKFREGDHDRYVYLSPDSAKNSPPSKP